MNWFMFRLWEQLYVTRISEAQFQDCFYAVFQMVGREYKWYVLYTRSQHEKQLHHDFGRLCIESFLPLVSTIRVWSDRKKRVDLPLFPNYLFVKASCREYSLILEHPSVIGIVKTGNEPSEVPDSTIDILKIALNERMELLRCDKEPEKGSRIAVVKGPLAGYEGKVIDWCGNHFLLIEVSQSIQSLMVRVSIDSLIIIEEKQRPCAVIL